MARLTRQLKTMSGAILGLIVMLIVVFFVLNLAQTKGPGPVAKLGSWVFQRASGEAYSGGGATMATATPAVMATSPYSMNGNLGPAL